jgi:demethylspheroidene O-methyltransferase
MPMAMRIESGFGEATAASSWSDWLFAARDSLLANRRFQRFSAGFPLTRRVAANQAAALFDLCAGFVYSQVLLACVRLDLFRRLASGPKPLSMLAAELRLSEDAAERLLSAACALNLVARRRGGRFGLGMLGAVLNGQPGIAAMVEHHVALYSDLADPVALLTAAHGDTALARYWAYARAEKASDVDADRAARYSKLMTSSLGFIADEVLSAYPFQRHSRVLDVGGGEGAFAATLARQHASLSVTVFDLPAVADRARDHLLRAGLSDRIDVAGGNFLEDELPRGADLVTLLRVVHDHDDAAVLRLLRSIAAVLPRGGKILIAEPLANAPGYERVGSAYFGMYLLAMGSGRPRSAEQIRELLARAGFARTEQHATRQPMLAGIVTAQKSV